MPISLRNWLDRSQPDYCMMFIRAWIPFNAWFRDEFYDANARNGDRELIDRLKDRPNIIKNRIKTLLVSSDSDGLRFRNLLADLHKKLEAHTIIQNGRTISLHNTCIADNSTYSDIISFGSYDYKCTYNVRASRGTNRIRCEVLSRRTGRTKHLIEILEWSVADLRNAPEFMEMEEKHKEKILECFQRINPKKPEVILKQVSPNLDGTFNIPNPCIVISQKDGLFIVNNTDLVSKVIIQLLYNLRCAIFHGQVDPTSTHMEIYHPAFEILHMLNTELV